MQLVVFTISTCDQALGVLHDRLEDALERLLQVVLQVVLAVDRKVVLQRKDGVLRLLPRLRTLRRLQDACCRVTNPGIAWVLWSQLRCTRCIAFTQRRHVHVIKRPVRRRQRSDHTGANTTSDCRLHAAVGARHLDDDVRHTVANGRRGGRVAREHPLRQLHVRALGGCVIFCRLRQPLVAQDSLGTLRRSTDELCCERAAVCIPMTVE